MIKGEIRSLEGNAFCSTMPKNIKQLYLRFKLKL